MLISSSMMIHSLLQEMYYNDKAQDDEFSSVEVDNICHFSWFPSRRRHLSNSDNLLQLN